MSWSGRWGWLVAGLLVAGPALPEQEGTLAKVRDRGVLRCGIDRSQAEYSSTEEHGSRLEFDRGLCRAIAVAALGAKARLAVTLYADGAAALRALAEGRTDIVPSVSASRELLNQPERDAVAFSAPILRDPVSIMVLRSDGVTNAAQLSGRLVCVLSETRAQEAVQSWFAQKRLDLVPFPFQEEGEMEAAFITRRCTGLVGDRTRLLQTQHDTGSMAHNYEILPEEMGTDALSTAYCSGDTEWAQLIDAVQGLIVGADRPGNDSADVAPGRNSGNEGAQAFFEENRELAKSLTLDADWARTVLAAIGSYKDLIDRSFNSNLSCEPLRIDEPTVCAR